MKTGIIIIGDELLSGKRRDRHYAESIRQLGARGMELAWCRIIGDDPALITATLRDTYAGPDLVFCFGGIGVTLDDHTRAAAAAAAGVALERHPAAVAELEAHYGAELSPARLLFAELPAGSRIIPNPYNRVPGFSVAHHHFLPGFTQMAWPMMAWVLDTQYAHLKRAQPDIERVLRVRAREGELLALMQDFVAAFPGCRLSSLPELGQTPALELGVRGAPGAVAAAITHWQAALDARDIHWQEVAAGPRQGSSDESA